MTLRAALFDFDGVIVESFDIKTDAFRQLFADEPQHLPAILAFHLANGGLSRFVKFEAIYRDIMRRPLSEAHKVDLGRRFSALVVDRVLNSPYVPGALEFLQTHSLDLPLFVASGTPDDELRAIVERRGLSGHFREVHGSPRGKDEIALDILRRYGWSSDEMILVGDAMTDYRAAQAVGLSFVGRVSDGALDPFPPDSSRVIIRDLFELAALWPTLAEA